MDFVRLTVDAAPSVHTGILSKPPSTAASHTVPHHNSPQMYYILQEVNIVMGYFCPNYNYNSPLSLDISPFPLICVSLSPP